MKIGYPEDIYPYERCVKNQTDAEYRLCPPRTGRQGKIAVFGRRAWTVACRRLGLRQSSLWNRGAFFRHRQLQNADEADVIHLFNRVYDGPKPWCCTFESQTPVTEDLIGRPWEFSEGQFSVSRFSKRMLRLCAGENCRGLIALSDSALRIEREMIARIDVPDALKTKLTGKLHVLPPPQPVLTDERELERKFSDVRTIRMLMIGHDFFRKGGLELLTALKELAGRYSFELTVISRLCYGDYASNCGQPEHDRCVRLLRSEPWIRYYETLPNPEVLALAKQAHLGFLPSVAETYGYSVLEMQACGCACVTTDIRAFAEINPEDCGWQCRLHPNAFGEAVYSGFSGERKNQVRAALLTELRRLLPEILEHPEEIRRRAENALRRIRTEHDPAGYSRKLTEIYARSEEKV